MGKNPTAYIQRTKVNKVEQKPEEIKFKISQPSPKQKVPVTTKEQMDAKTAKKQEKRKLKKQVLEVILLKNTDEMNKLKEFAKKQKTI